MQVCLQIPQERLPVSSTTPGVLGVRLSFPPQPQCLCTCVGGLLSALSLPPMINHRCTALGGRLEVTVQFLSDPIPAIRTRQAPYVRSSERSLPAILPHPQSTAAACSAQSPCAGGFPSVVLLLCPQTAAGWRASQFCLATGLSGEHSGRSCAGRLGGSVGCAAYGTLRVSDLSHQPVLFLRGVNICLM